MPSFCWLKQKSRGHSHQSDNKYSWVKIIGVARAGHRYCFRCVFKRTIRCLLGSNWSFGTLIESDFTCGRGKKKEICKGCDNGYSKVFGVQEKNDKVLNYPYQILYHSEISLYLTFCFLLQESKPKKHNDPYT